MPHNLSGTKEFGVGNDWATVTLNKSFPCSSCTALCCGPVALSRDRLEKIFAYLRTMPKAERKRLAKQKRDSLDCGFLDKANHRCSIYPVRPWVCETFGRVKGMKCPMTLFPVAAMPEFIEETEFAAEYKSGEVGDSSHFNWSKL